MPQVAKAAGKVLAFKVSAAGAVSWEESTPAAVNGSTGAHENQEVCSASLS